MPDDDQKVVFLERDVAEEVLELVEDEPGEADEDLLDDALEAIESADGALPSEAQQAVARGEAVAVGMDPDEIATLATLIEANTETDSGTLKSIATTIKSKLKAAAKKARRRNKN